MSLFSKPEVVIYKQSSCAKEYLVHLEELYVKAKGEIKEKIEKEIKITKAGIAGEDQILFELKNSGMNLYVLQDVYLECDDLSAQIDFYVITPKIDFIIECKNLVGNIEINNKGEFIRTFECGRKKYKEGIYSPVTQNERHLLVIKNKKMKDVNFLQRAMIEKCFETFYKSLVVLANPRTILNDRFAKKEVKEKVIRADQLITTIKYMCNQSKECSRTKAQMEKTAKSILANSIGERTDYLEKYRRLLEVTENGGVQREPKVQTAIKSADALTVKTCPRCGKRLVKRKGQYGEFYGCSTFPRCRYTEKISFQVK